MNKKFYVVPFISVLFIVLSAFSLCSTANAACKVKLNRKKVTLYTPGYDDTCKLKATVTGSAKAVTWTSSNAAVASVNSDGFINAYKSGVTTVTASVSGAKASCKVTVKYRKNGNFGLYFPKAQVAIGSYVGILDRNLDYPSGIVWKSSKPAVATVSDGYVYGKKAGKAIITGKYNGKKLKCKVSVVDMKKVLPLYKEILTSQTVELNGQLRSLEDSLFVKSDLGQNGVSDMILLFPSKEGVTEPNAILYTCKNGKVKKAAELALPLNTGHEVYRMAAGRSFYYTDRESWSDFATYDYRFYGATGSITYLGRHEQHSGELTYYNAKGELISSEEYKAIKRPYDGKSATKIGTFITNNEANRTKYFG